MNGHDSSHPDHLANILGAEVEAHLATCEECGVVPVVLAASGARFVLGVDHGPACSQRVESD